MAIIIMAVIVLQKYTFLLKLPNNSEKNCFTIRRFVTIDTAFRVP